jgi:hypothetical protein
MNISYRSHDDEFKTQWLLGKYKRIVMALRDNDIPWGKMPFKS